MDGEVKKGARRGAEREQEEEKKRRREEGRTRFARLGALKRSPYNADLVRRAGEFNENSLDTSPFVRLRFARCNIRRNFLREVCHDDRPIDAE
jgi:hypothetical protein